jgi:hypothetical protein
MEVEATAGNAVGLVGAIAAAELPTDPTTAQPPVNLLPGNRCS